MRTIRNLLPIAASLIIVLPLAASSKQHHNQVDQPASLNSGSGSAISQPVNAAPLTDKKKRLAQGITKIEIDAPRNVVWSVLTDFQQYPQIFRGIQSCKVTRREGELVFTESYLKPHMFLSEPRQRAVNDLSAAPQALTWHTLDGNFKSLEGKWELKSMPGDRCLAIYTLAVDPGACVPAPLVSMALRSMQKEIVGSLKRSAESRRDETGVKTSDVPQARRAG